MSVCALEYLGPFRRIMIVQDDFLLRLDILRRRARPRQRLMPGHPKVFVSPNGVRLPAPLRRLPGRPGREASRRRFFTDRRLRLVPATRGSRLRASSRCGGTEVGPRQSHGCLEGKREYVPLTTIALPELDANSALCKVDAAQLREGNPAVGAAAADLPENQAEWRVPRRMRRRPDPYGDIPAVGLEIQGCKLPRTHVRIGQLLCELRQIRCSVHSPLPPR